MTDEPYTKREQDAFRNEMSQGMKKQDEMLTKIYDQTSKWDERVTKLEERTSDYSEMKKMLVKHENWRWYVLGISAAVLLMGAYIYKITMDSIYQVIDSKIKDSQSIIISAIDDQLKGSPSNFTNSVNVR